MFRIGAATSILALAVALPIFADDEPAKTSEFEGQDGASLTAAQMEAGYSLPTLSHANVIGLANTAGTAATTDLADLATRALKADDADKLSGNSSSYYTNASNFSTGTLNINRLVGSLVDSDNKILNSLLSGETYDISITGNAATATTATSATRCTGGASNCDFGTPAPAPTTYDWSYSGWSSWSSCSGGSQSASRSVWCERSDGATVSDSYCSGSKPSSSKTQSCSSASYSWWAGSWGSWAGCATDPSAGTRTRTVECRNDLTGAKISTTYCAGATKPATSETKACPPPPTGLKWVFTPFPSSVTCPRGCTPTTYAKSTPFSGEKRSLSAPSSSATCTAGSTYTHVIKSGWVAKCTGTTGVCMETIQIKRYNCL